MLSIQIQAQEHHVPLGGRHVQGEEARAGGGRDQQAAVKRQVSTIQCIIQYNI